MSDSSSENTTYTGESSTIFHPDDDTGTSSMPDSAAPVVSANAWSKYNDVKQLPNLKAELKNEMENLIQSLKKESEVQVEKKMMDAAVKLGMKYSIELLKFVQNISVSENHMIEFSRVFLFDKDIEEICGLIVMSKNKTYCAAFLLARLTLAQILVTHSTNVKYKYMAYAYLKKMVTSCMLFTVGDSMQDLRDGLMAMVGKSKSSKKDATMFFPVLADTIKQTLKKYPVSMNSLADNIEFCMDHKVSIETDDTMSMTLSGAYDGMPF